MTHKLSGPGWRLSPAALAELPPILDQSLLGLERECLRIAPSGTMSARPHPRGLGSPLTHPYLTTDFSEALLELITPPFTDLTSVLGFLEDLHRFVVAQLDDEVLWAASMPCPLDLTQPIPLAYYGESNRGRMKTVYRQGLGHRYGRVMQVIAGVHANYSLPASLWPGFQDALGEGGALRDWTDAQYFAMLRNLQRIGWLMPYLFGASPCVDPSFIAGIDACLGAARGPAHHYPFATSLRMGDIGYHNRQEEGVGIKASYDSLDAYLRNLTWAIETPCPRYESIGVVDAKGDYLQLNPNVLQIENEYYSSVRPKQPLQGLEKPTVALRQRGVRYLELRSLDVNPFSGIGVTEEQLRFVELMMLYSLFVASPLISREERAEIDDNLLAVAHYGRDDGLRLRRQGRNLCMRDWALEILDGMQMMLDALSASVTTRAATQECLNVQRQRVTGVLEVFSARMQREMDEQGEDFNSYALRLSREHAGAYGPLTPERRTFLDTSVSTSLDELARIESQPEPPFAAFLANYFRQRALD